MQGYDGLPTIAESSLQSRQIDHSMMQGGLDQMTGDNDSGGDGDNGKGPKGRGLSQSKRAAQNRAAQVSCSSCCSCLIK